jgi:hypothetical protein
MSGATKRRGESPVEHARCGLPPITVGSSVVCPACFDVCARNSLRAAVSAWNEIQGGIVSAAKTLEQRERNARYQREFRARKAAQQQSEVRGIFAHVDDHAAIKAVIITLCKERQRMAA